MPQETYDKLTNQLTRATEAAGRFQDPLKPGRTCLAVQNSCSKAFSFLSAVLSTGNLNDIPQFETDILLRYNQALDEEVERNKRYPTTAENIRKRRFIGKYTAYEGNDLVNKIETRLKNGELLGFRLTNSKSNDHYFTVALNPDGNTLLFLQAFEGEYDLATWINHYEHLPEKFTLVPFLNALRLALSPNAVGTDILNELAKTFLIQQGADYVHATFKSWWPYYDLIVNEPVVKFPESNPVFYLAVYVLPFVERRTFVDRDVCEFPEEFNIPVPKKEDQSAKKNEAKQRKKEDKQKKPKCPSKCKIGSKIKECLSCFFKSGNK